MKRWLLIAIGIVVGLPLAVALIGSFIPRDHVARRTIDLAAPPDRVWTVVSDFANAAKWRTDITAVRMQPASGGSVRFTESSDQGEVPFEVVSQDPPRRQVVRIVDDEQPFGGTWTWDLDASGSGTRLTITEAGFIKNPIFRAIGAVFFSPTATIEAYMRALAKQLGETAEPKER